MAHFLVKLTIVGGAVMLDAAMVLHVAAVFSPLL